MFDFDEFEETAGHELTMVQGLLAGVSTYCCENCGALVQIGGPENKMVLFHVPRGSLSTEKKCVRPGTGLFDSPTLKDKLRVLHEESMERLRLAAED